MAKLIFLFICMSLALFSSSQSTSFQCHYKTSVCHTLGTIYGCSVQNALSISITSLDAAQVDSISGTHKAGYNNDNVEGFWVNRKKSQINYFPLGLNKFFKNLKGIEIAYTGMKEIHQSDLKDFPNLVELHLYGNNLEIIEENLFEFNSNLELIDLESNKISHIDPNVFDKLTKLKSMNLNSNNCIIMTAWNNPTEVQNVIKEAKAKCTNSDYSNLEQKVKKLEIESKNLNSENLKEKLENLEKEIKNSKFSNFFQDSLKALKIEKDKKQFSVIIENTNDKVSVMNEAISNLSNKITASINEAQKVNGEKFNKISNLLESNAQKVNTIESKSIKIQSNLEKIEEKIQQNQQKVDENFTKLNQKLTNLDTKVQNVVQQTSTSLKSFEAGIDGKFEDIKAVIENVGKKIEENVMQKVKKILNEFKVEIQENQKKIVENFKVLNEKVTKIDNLDQKVSKIDQKTTEIDGKIVKFMKTENNQNLLIFNKVKESNQKMEAVDSKLTTLNTTQQKNQRKIDDSFSNLDQKIVNFENETSTSLQALTATSDGHAANLKDIIENVGKRLQENVTEKLENKFGDIKDEIGRKFEENSGKIDENLTRMSTNLNEKLSNVNETITNTDNKCSFLSDQISSLNNLTLTNLTEIATKNAESFIISMKNLKISIEDVGEKVTESNQKLVGLDSIQESLDDKFNSFQEEAERYRIKNIKKLKEIYHSP